MGKIIRMEVYDFPELIQQHDELWVIDADHNILDRLIPETLKDNHIMTTTLIRNEYDGEDLKIRTMWSLSALVKHLEKRAFLYSLEDD